MDEARVIELVEKHLKDPEIADLSLTVVHDAVHHDGAWWYVPVVAAHEPKRRWQYYELIAEVEDAVSAEVDINIMLVPVAAEDPQPAC